MLRKVSMYGVIATALLQLIGCDPEVASARSGASYPSLPAGCPLELIEDCVLPVSMAFGTARFVKAPP